MKNGKVSGLLSLKGKHHETQIELRSDGTWVSSYTNKGKDSNWSISIENGKSSVALQKRL